MKYINKTRAGSVLLAAVLTLTLVSLTSCSGILKPVSGLLGVDTYDYAGEEVTAKFAADSERAAELAGFTRMLAADSLTLYEFGDSKSVVSSCADSVLAYMLRTNYTKYSGNKKLLDTVEKQYPQLQITTVITASDFENTVYKYFGGNEVIKHKSGGVFTYLDKAQAYTSVGQIYPDEIVVEVISLEETDSTYRLTFYNRLGDKNSPVYYAVFIKRTGGDGTVYFHSLRQIADGRTNAPVMASYN